MTNDQPIKRLPNQRWQIAPANPELAQNLADLTNISPIISQLLINRGMKTPEDAQVFLSPETLDLPSPLEDFPDLAVSVELLEDAIANQEKIAICGDYDADGMTSTALLLRSLRALGANVDYAIPSRMHEGYGINKRIIEEFHSEGVGLVLTVDNGISAFEPIARARELGLKVIITDHHDIPPILPPANAILNPKLIAESSPYRGVAGVGVAYILAVCLAQQLGQIKGLVQPMLALFTLGTIADLAPLTGVNRRWVKRGLKLLPKSTLPGVQALIQVAGVQAIGAEEQGSRGAGEKVQNPKSLKPEDIGFRLGPRINAIGRIGNPQTVIELLTTDDMGLALERAMQCEQINIQRQQMCEQIEQEAIALVEDLYVNSLQKNRVLVVVKDNWHHGVIGIVASRLLERYGVPVFIGTFEDEGVIRGSARGIPEFNVFAALEYCRDLLGKFGGHKAAGGFSLPADNLLSVRSRLSEFANQCLEPQHLKPLLKIDAQANLNQINQDLYQQLNILHPCGIDNPDPIFWTPNAQVIEQQIVGKGHIKLTLAQTVDNIKYQIKAIAWRWRDYFPLPARVDIAYKLRENHFNDKISIEMELVGVRLPAQSPIFSTPPSQKLRANFEYKQRQYTCGVYQNGVDSELRIKNPEGKVLVMQPGDNHGLLGSSRDDAKKVNLSLPQYDGIIQAAIQALDS
ncbi:single-stranded-DNA-specific exonuclease RecJ [Anabaena cylindrica FACHB-243]|uniref:Single-stranded-DNA-specific exonuclease RecJ n=1 Tax=Anabaena cylindrica (strain ATCC 27899 / PCC 7122) TaxID=272123 RepID=K9ZNP7_ANACC|nr:MULTISPECIES: single-stranded-DNA-specific exonuclease RecJ [Anabaena]AFZ60414.1 single-stranded-DNA-specific exonuclease RecJ [Anabaena cylindrica PCC 7122]MBD2416402.1 single-stranded-DNA-specific exonuclease RecJ [Anabaena cylindrica FACHB-243]MBY5308245.1 single-stranded-DNA-specific exonuclease RecJ [Anabaena sp. CCAP 1446/1C]MCM2408455.1 single-stranded-DNA-specific exonuclease RecJ [Anabaena sp. CCAP 1446/1C]BAY02511.1 single-stranded-DNA-specific exonuclease RecJ [Anabaena cylindric